jgi:hypothetical protein
VPAVVRQRALERSPQLQSVAEQSAQQQSVQEQPGREQSSVQKASALEFWRPARLALVPWLEAQPPP